VTERNLVFISHANDEDNEFTSWLGTRLIGAGYEVWADLFRLVGGEPFWTDIGDAIRDHAAIVIVVLSNSSIKKPGVLKEIAMAVATGRKLNQPSFVIPVRIDDLAHFEFPPEVFNLNAIDFSQNWADGLHKVQNALAKAAISRNDTISSIGFEQLRTFRLRQTAAIANVPEKITSNWLSIKSLPKTVSYCRFGAESKLVAEALTHFRTPIVPWERLGLSFSNPAAIIENDNPAISVEHAYDVNLANFLDGKSEAGPGIKRVDARRMIVNLLRQSWERFAESRGLLPYDFANSRGWFVPRDLLEKNDWYFIDEAGRRRPRRLVGRSEKRQVYWHFAVTAYASVGEMPHLVLRPQVVFTTDGSTPLESKPRAARLRRSFCKMWWNDRWYGLFRAFVSFLAEGQSEFALPLGPGQSAVIDAASFTFEAPLSIVNDIPIAAEEPVEESETAADALDDPDDIADPDDLEEVA
jgi:TIR domain-containing protein